jgi:hypothetical protein
MGDRRAFATNATTLLYSYRVDENETLPGGERPSDK